MTLTANPLTDAIADGYSVRNHLNEDAHQMRLALENRHYMQQSYTSAKRGYEDAEAEWLADFTWTDSRYQACKNSEQREICKDAALVKARQTGVLAIPWRTLNDTKLSFDNAELTYQQAEVSFKATKAAAEITAQALRAASI